MNGIILVGTLAGPGLKTVALVSIPVPASLVRRNNLEKVVPCVRLGRILVHIHGYHYRPNVSFVHGRSRGAVIGMALIGLIQHIEGIVPGNGLCGIPACGIIQIQKVNPPPVRYSITIRILTVDVVRTNGIRSAAIYRGSPGIPLPVTHRNVIGTAVRQVHLDIGHKGL